jgi:transcriptional regulator with XRE-family HTH domain
MEGHPWQIRAKEAGLSQRLLARIAGKSDNTISRQLRGEFGEVPGYLVAIIIAWEGMNADKREDWLQQVEGELQRRNG